MRNGGSKPLLADTGARSLRRERERDNVVPERGRTQAWVVEILGSLMFTLPRQQQQQQQQLHAKLCLKRVLSIVAVDLTVVLAWMPHTHTHTHTRRAGLYCKTACCLLPPHPALYLLATPPCASFLCGPLVGENSEVWYCVCVCVSVCVVVSPTHKYHGCLSKFSTAPLHGPVPRLFLPSSKAGARRCHQLYNTI